MGAVKNWAIEHDIHIAAATARGLKGMVVVEFVRGRMSQVDERYILDQLQSRGFLAVPALRASEPTS